MKRDQQRNESVKLLHQKYYKKLFRIAYVETGSVQDAEDLVQDTYALAILHYDEFCDYDAPEAWLVITLKHRIHNFRRLQERHNEVPLEDNLIVLEQKSQGLEELLPQELSEEDRKLLIWRFEQQLDYVTLANQLGIKEDTCRKRISRALQRCKKYL